MKEGSRSIQMFIKRIQSCIAVIIQPVIHSLLINQMLSSFSEQGILTEWLGSANDTWS